MTEEVCDKGGGWRRLGEVVAATVEVLAVILPEVFGALGFLTHPNMNRCP